jgi:hypothetical protein
MHAKAGARVTNAICPQIWFLPRVTVVVAREPNGLRARYENFIEAAEQWPTVATTYVRAHIRRVQPSLGEAGSGGADAQPVGDA